MASAIKDGPPATQSEEEKTTIGGEELWAILEMCWDRDPERRPKVREVARLLDDVERIIIAEDGNML